MLTVVRIYRGNNRGGFVVDHESIDEFERKLAGLASVVLDAEWKCYPVPEGMTELDASRKAI